MILVGKPEERDHLEDLCVDGRIMLAESGCEDVNCIRLAQDWVQSPLIFQNARNHCQILGTRKMA